MQELERGDVVVHPQYGPAAVRSFADRVVGGEATQYVVLETLGNGMRIKAPVGNLDAIGVRALLLPEELEDVLGVLRTSSGPIEPRWSARLKAGEELLRTGSLGDAAIVARDFSRRERERELSIRESQIKEHAVRRVAAELSAVRHLTVDDARAIVDAAIFGEDVPVGDRSGGAIAAG
jgi:CarD family transcriptional regulator